MGVTPDRTPGVSEEEGTIYSDEGVDPSVVGEVRHNAGDLKAKDQYGVFNLRQGAFTHKTLHDLIHFIDSGPAGGFASGAFFEVLPSADPFPTSEIWWESAAKLKKIVELTITRNANKTVAVEAWQMYDTDGTTVLETVTDTYAYSGIFVLSVTRVIA